MNKIYIYNDSFINLINLIFYLLKNKITPSNIKNRQYTPSLFDDCIFLDIKENEKLIKDIINCFGKYAFKCTYYVYLSPNEDKELIIYYFLLNALKYRQNITYMRNLKCVTKTLQIEKHVANENHKMKGFTRFKELKNNILYAEIAPINDILDLLSNHFKKRLKNEYWIIKDVNRKIISIYDKKQYFIIPEENLKIEELSLSNKEEQIELLWKTFYKTIGIEERKNDRCRRNFMPKRYWKYITEMRDEI